MIRAGLDLVHPRKACTESFEDYIIEKYGRTLYRAFFKPYTEKFLDYTCSNLHRDWAEAGINRATIDKQIRTNSLGALVRSLLFAKNPKTKFLYPKTGGVPNGLGSAKPLVCPVWAESYWMKGANRGR